MSRPKIQEYKIIDKERWYTLPDVARMGNNGLFPIKHPKHIKKFIELGKIQGKDIGTKNRCEFRIQGCELLNFMSKKNK